MDGMSITAVSKMLIALVAKNLIPLIWEQISRKSKALEEVPELLTDGYGILAG